MNICIFCHGRLGRCARDTSSQSNPRQFNKNHFKNTRLTIYKLLDVFSFNLENFRFFSSSWFCPSNMIFIWCTPNAYFILVLNNALDTHTHALTFHTSLMNKCTPNLSLFLLIFSIKIRNCFFRSFLLLLLFSATDFKIPDTLYTETEHHILESQYTHNFNGHYLTSRFLVDGVFFRFSSKENFDNFLWRFFFLFTHQQLHRYFLQSSSTTSSFLRTKKFYQICEICRLFELSRKRARVM